MRFVVMEMHKLPSEYLALSKREQALIAAIAVDTYAKKAKEAEEFNKKHNMKG